MTQKTIQPTTAIPHLDEQILVVKRKLLFPFESAWHGLKTDGLNEFLECVNKHQEFMPRSLAENDESYKQIIPYAIFQHKDRYFLMQRQSGASEQRLKSKYLLGIGGHVRQEDMIGSSIFDWAMREFHEEVEYHHALVPKTLGILNDDSNPVGRVHIGLVLLLNGDSDQIKIKSELQQGFLATKEECQQYQHVMEGWSSILMEHLP